MAVRLGIVNVDKMLRGLTAKQLAGWMRYAAVEPFNFDTELRADYRAASIVQVIANVNRDPKKTAYALQDFLLKFEEEKGAEQKQTRETHIAWIKMMMMAYSQPAKDM